MLPETDNATLLVKPALPTPPIKFAPVMVTVEGETLYPEDGVTAVTVGAEYAEPVTVKTAALVADRPALSVTTTL